MSGKEQSKDVLIGVVSDTHGLLRPEVAKAFIGVDIIAHAGDIDHPAILEALEKIAPVVAVRGNMDSSRWARRIRQTEIFEAGGIMMYMLHNLFGMETDPLTEGVGIVISGHTHIPLIREENGILFLNPGSAGPRRHDYPVSAALLRIRDKLPKAQIIKFEP